MKTPLDNSQASGDAPETADDNGPDLALQGLARQLTGRDGLGEPLLLRLNRRDSTLVSCPQSDSTAEALSIRLEGGNNAAARALFTHAPVLAYRDARETSALDRQLAGAHEGILAIPVKEGPRLGVLLVAGSRAALESIANSMSELPASELPNSELPKSELPLQEKGETPLQAAFEVEPETDPWLAGRVRRAAYEIANPLGIIKNYLAILKARLGNAGIEDELRIINEELDRVARIMRALTQDEVSLGELREETDLGQLTEDLVRVTAPSWQPRGMRISHRPGHSLPLLTVDRDKLKQVLLNLLLNALESSPDGGEVRLETAQVTNHRRERFVELQVADSGPGIAPDRIDDLFAPHDAGTADGPGSLGMAGVKHLAEELGGSLSYKSGPTGTTFQILFRVG